MDHTHEYIGFQGNKKTGYALLITDGYASYGGIPEPVTRRIQASELKPENIETIGSGKARFTRLRRNAPIESVGGVQAKLRNAAKELKSRSIQAAIGSFAIAGGARVAGELLVPGTGEITSKFSEKAIKACTWVAESSGDAGVIFTGTAGVGLGIEEAARFLRVYKFRLKMSIDGKNVSIECAMPIHHFRHLLQEIEKQEGK